MKTLLTVTALLVWSLTAVQGQGEGVDLIAISGNGVAMPRIHCEERIICSGIGETVFWTFLGVATPLINTATLFTEVDMFTNDDGDPIIQSALVLSPADQSHNSFYQCQVEGSVPFSITLRVVVNTNPLEIVSDISNIDLSSQTIGDNITVACQVDTCVSEVTVQLHKDNTMISTQTVTNNTMNAVIVAFPITVDENTAGKYSCQAIAIEGSTLPSFFNITGVPLEPSTSVVVMATTVTTPSTNVVMPSSTSQVSMSGIVGTSGQATPTSSVSMATMYPSTSPGGASTLIIEWTLLLSLLIMTFVSSLFVW